MDANKVAEEDYKRQVRQHELDMHQLIAQEYANNIQARKKYADRLFLFLCIYMIVVFLIVFLQGAGKIKLDASIVNTLLVTVTANVIGIYNLVAKYLFHVDEKSNPSKQIKGNQPNSGQLALPKSKTKTKKDKPSAIEEGTGSNEATV